MDYWGSISSSVKHSQQKKSAEKKPKVRQHQGIHQRGPKKGKLRKGYKYTGEQNMNGMPKIEKTKK
jgi:hypothetical protein